MTPFFRFPNTPHIRWLAGGSARGDKILSEPEVADLLSGEVTVEEKVDGANIGVSLDDAGRLRAQNRGQFLEEPFRGQFSRLPAWLAEHEQGLRNVLDEGTILFGEWCAAVHSVFYDRLPDWFLLFDVYDRSAGRFHSVVRRNERAAKSGLCLAPQLCRGRVTVGQLVATLSDGESRVGSEGMEGLVVRKDDGGWNEARGKLVKGSFVQAIETHWKRAPLRWNRVAYD